MEAVFECLARNRGNIIAGIIGVAFDVPLLSLIIGEGAVQRFTRPWRILLWWWLNWSRLIRVDVWLTRGGNVLERRHDVGIRARYEATLGRLEVTVSTVSTPIAEAFTAIDGITCVEARLKASLLNGDRQECTL
jgi:hypothetical protein